MDRKDFLKSACTLGICGCTMRFLGAIEPVQAAEPPATPPAEDQRLMFAKYQVANMVGFLAKDAPAGTCAAILEKTGRECAKLGQLGRFKDKPEAYFAAAKKAYGTEMSWDKEKGIITVAVPDNGPCGCPLVDPKRTPVEWCSCSVGYQKEAFESIFGKPVQARLKESKLQGAKRCVFEVTVS